MTKKNGSRKQSMTEISGKRDGLGYGKLFDMTSSWEIKQHSINNYLFPYRNFTHQKHPTKSRLKLHLEQLKMTGVIMKIERVDTLGRNVTQETTVNNRNGDTQPVVGMVIGYKQFVILEDRKTGSQET